MYRIRQISRPKWLIAYVLIAVAIAIGSFVLIESFGSDCIRQFEEDAGIRHCYTSRSTRNNDEQEIVDALLNWEPVYEERYDESFPGDLAQSIAFNRVGDWSFGKIEEVSSDEYDQVQDIEMRYPGLPFPLSYLYSRHAGPTSRLAIVLHGHSSTRWKIMGLDNIDYTGAIGNWFYHRGYDVVAPALTEIGQVSAIIHQNLLVTGNTLYGVWVTQVCDLLEWAHEDGKYSEVVLYGISNGGKIANYSSVLCEGFDLVIVDDQLQDLRKNLFKKSRGKNFRKSYIFANFYDHIGINTFSNLLLNLRNDTIFILKEDLHSEINENVINISEKNNVKIFIKDTDLHTPEIKLIEKAVNLIEDRQ